MRTYLLIVLFGVVLIGCSQKSINNSIITDPSISEHLDSLVQIQYYQDYPMGEMLFHVREIPNYEEFEFENYLDLFGLMDFHTWDEKYMGGTCDCKMILPDGASSIGDTIKISGGNGYGGGLGFDVLLIQNDNPYAEVTLFHPELVYAKKEGQKMTNEIAVNSSSIQLTLLNKPKFELGEQLEGLIYIRTEPFYHLDKKQKLRRIEPEFELVFTCKTIGVLSTNSIHW